VSSWIAALLAPPLVTAAVAMLVRPYRRWVAVLGALASCGSLVAAIRLAAYVIAHREAVSGPFRLDGLSALLVLCIAFVGCLSAVLGPPVYAGQGYDGVQLRRMCAFGSIFVAAMLFAVTVNNLALMWVAIEATTITSAVLIPLHVTKASVEASWKYILLGGVGIALAFAGTVLTYFDFTQRVGAGDSALNWTSVVAAAPLLHAEVLRLAFAFVLLGYGTKAGIAPMHTWLPDAHAEAPSSVSALMSGVLLAVATYAVMRWKAVLDASAVGAAYTNRLLIAFGLLSLGLAAFSLLAQRNYKRMLAYSSVEHSGLIWLGVGLGPAGVFAAMLHLVNHAIGKSALFLLSGRVLHRYRSTEIASAPGLLGVMPVTGLFFAAGMLALVGLPPFGLFVSELRMIAAGFAEGRPALMTIVLALLVVAFVGLVRSLNRMLHGDVPQDVERGETGAIQLVPIAICIGLLTMLGFGLPNELRVLLNQIAGPGVP
jgi:hydrogenase-4 component F